MMRLITKYLKLSFLLFIFTTAAVAQDLTILSYNIRYNSQSDGEDLWDLRKEDLVSQIKKHSPDSFGVQEATEIQMQYILEALPNYVYVGVGRDDGANKGEYSAVFYLKENFELLKVIPFGCQILQLLFQKLGMQLCLGFVRMQNCKSVQMERYTGTLTPILIT